MMEVLLPALKLSALVAFWATLISLPFAIFIAYILARYEFWGKAILNIFIHLSLILPPVVTGYVLLKIMGRRGFIGEWLESTFGISIAFHWTGAVLAAAVMAFPLMVRAIRQAIEAIDPHIEISARALGASAFTTFRRITLPLAMPGIWVGSVLCFAKAMGEFGATITFVSNIPGVTQTLPLAIQTELQSINGENIVIALALTSVIISVFALMISEIMNKRARRKLF